VDKIKGWKTVAFNVIMGAIAFIHALNPTAELPNHEMVQAVFTNADTLIMGVMAVGNLILRAFTTTPVFKAQPKQGVV
jgi:hypothetical protein